MALGKNQTAPSKVFQDNSGIRRRVFILVATITLLTVASWAADFFNRVARLEGLSPLDQQAQTVARVDGALLDVFEVSDSGQINCNRSPMSAGRGHSVFAYLPINDPKSIASLRTQCGSIDALLYEAFTFGAPDGTVRPLVWQSGNTELGEFLKPEGRLAGYPVIRPGSGLFSEDIEALISDPVSRNALVNGLSGVGREVSATGVCLDLSEHGEIAAGPLGQLLAALAVSTSYEGRETCIIAMADAPFWADATLVRSLDRAVVMTFRRAESPSASPAPQPWFNNMVGRITAQIPAEKLVVALGTASANWQSGNPSSGELSYAEAMWLTSRFDGEISFAEGSKNTHIRFVDETRQLNQIWLHDATLFYNQMLRLPEAQSLAIWPLGYEAPAIWPLLAATSGEQPSILRQPVTLPAHIAVMGNGPFSALIEPARDGRRIVNIDEATREVISQSYDVPPRPLTISRFGSFANEGLAMTFNGLPLKENLPNLLATLDRYNIQATFFLTEMDLLRQSDTAVEIADAGHALGSIFPISGVRIWNIESDWRMSLKSMQHLLTHLTGHRSALVRAPSGRLWAPSDSTDVGELLALFNNGYIPVTGGISAPDTGYDPAAFVATVRATGIQQPSPVLSFNLASQSADAIIASLPQVIEALQGSGFQFTSLEALSGYSHAELMPASSAAQSWRDSLSYAALQFWYFGLSTVFLVLMSIAAVRSLTYLLLAVFRRPHNTFDPDYQPEVTVLVPAFNEENVIERCVNSILDSDYPNVRVVVIDDGSSDHTATLVTEKFGQDPRVSLIHQENQGKWSAENNALSHIKSPIFVGVDADTIILPDAISWLVQQFKDESVGAVAGFVEVGNRKNYLTACQTIEYLVSQAISRRGFEVFNGILVVPGAIGAWRTEAVRKAGYYSGNTITEDADLTLSVHRAGYKVRFQEQARAITEAPATVEPFLKQRLRWILGMLQTSWKHRKAITERRSVGYISILDAIWFSLATSILSPLVDLLLIGMLVSVIYSMVTIGSVTSAGLPIFVLVSYFILVAIDMVNTAVAFRLERRFDWKLFLLVPLMRFGYRQLIYFSSLRAIVRAITGRLANWNKLGRTGTVRLSKERLRRLAKLKRRRKQS